jgi:hypothetical protein
LEPLGREETAERKGHEERSQPGNQRTIANEALFAVTLLVTTQLRQTVGACAARSVRKIRCRRLGGPHSIPNRDGHAAPAGCDDTRAGPAHIRIDVYPSVETMEQNITATRSFARFVTETLCSTIIAIIKQYHYAADGEDDDRENQEADRDRPSEQTRQPARDRPEQGDEVEVGRASLAEAKGSVESPHGPMRSASHAGWALGTAAV